VAGIPFTHKFTSWMMIVTSHATCTIASQTNKRVHFKKPDVASVAPVAIWFDRIIVDQVLALMILIVLFLSFS